MTPTRPGPRATKQRLATHYEITHALAEGVELSAVAPSVLAALCEGLGWRTAAIWSMDEGGRDHLLRCAAIWTKPGLDAWRSVTMDMRMKLGEGLPGRVWSSRAPAWIDDVSDDENLPRRAVALRAGLHHGVAVPVLLRGRVYAVIEGFGPRARKPDDDVMAFVESVGKHLALFLERVETRRALIESEARKAGVLEGAVDAIVSADEVGRILDFNPAAERLFGRTRSAVLGRRIVDLLVPAELRTAHRNGLRRYLETRVPRIIGQRVRTEALRSDGTTVEVELTITEVAMHGRPMFTAFIRDVTAQRHAEIARERFLEILSHELRTPVTAIYGGSSMLSRPSLSPDASAELLSGIGEEAHRLYRLVEDLMVLARAERGATEVSLEPVHLDRIAESLTEGQQQHWPGIEVQVSRDPRGSRPVLGDETYVGQILRNLLSNAAKYASAGRTVEIVTEYDDAEGRVRVLDRGPGLRAEEANRLFEIDFRSSLTDSAAQGFGIGLFVARWLAENMGGRIWAHSRPTGGSEFGFALRIVDADDVGAPGGTIVLARPGDPARPI